LSTIGFLQYISPTISLFIGIFLYKERVTEVNMIGLCFIWAALAVYSYSLLRLQRVNA
jgi:chloramphenicol-sensitive protein RarD